jgi:isoleucyl-tRNA synthetase
MPDRLDVAPLTAKGQSQSKKAGEQLAKQKIDGIFSSQFIRARQTAEIIGEHVGLQPVLDQRINEFFIGPVFEGHSYDEFHAAFPTDNKALRFHQAPPGGETWLDVRQRMFAFLHEIDAAHEGKTFVIVTHADPILVVDWALHLRAEQQLPPEYPANGEPLEYSFSAKLFAPDGSFDPHRPYIDDAVYPCSDCKAGTMKRVPEVADTWFDSGSMPFAQWHYPFENNDRIESGQSYPAGYISEFHQP